MFENRAANKFTAIQSVAIAELDGHTDLNAYGHLPFVDLDVTQPAVMDGPQNDYWDHVDFMITAADRIILEGAREAWAAMGGSDGGQGVWARLGWAAGAAPARRGPHALTACLLPVRPV